LGGEESLGAVDEQRARFVEAAGAEQGFARALLRALCNDQLPSPSKRARISTHSRAVRSAVA